MTHIQLQVGKGQQSLEQAFNNVQNIVRKCKDPALDADEREYLQEAMQTLASRINKATELENELAQLKEAHAAEVRELEALLPPKELKKRQDAKEDPSDDASKSGAAEPKDAPSAGSEEPEKS